MEDQRGLRMGALKTGALVGVAGNSGRLGTLAVGTWGMGHPVWEML